MLCLVGREGASVIIVVCYDSGVGRGVVLRYGRLKCVLQFLDFWAPYEIGRNRAAWYCALQREGKSVAAVVCYDRGMGRGVVL